MDIIFDCNTTVEFVFDEDVVSHIKSVCEVVLNRLNTDRIISSIEYKRITTEAIRRNFKEVADMKSLGLAYEDVLEEYGNMMLDEKIQRFFNKIGKVVVNGLYGKFTLSKKSSKNIASHYFTNEMGYAIGQIDKVLRKGRALFYERKYKGKSFDRILIAAPIEIKTDQMIKEKECIMGVAANINKANNTLNNVNIYIIEEGRTPHSPSTTDNQSSTSGVARPSIVRLLQEVVDVKNGRLSLDKVTAIGIDSK